MRDPFPPNVKAQLFREAQIGFCVVALLLGLFAYITYHRLTGRGHRIPEYVSNGPLPNEVLPASDESEKTRESRPPPKKTTLPRPHGIAMGITPLPVAPVPRIHQGNQVEFATALGPVNELPIEASDAHPLQSVTDAIRDETLSPYTDAATSTSITTRVEIAPAVTTSRPTPDSNFPSQHDSFSSATEAPAPMIQHDIARVAVHPSTAAAESSTSPMGPSQSQSVFQMFAESVRNSVGDAVGDSVEQTVPQTEFPSTKNSDATESTISVQTGSRAIDISNAIDTTVPTTLERPNRTSDDLRIYVTKPGDNFWSVADAVYRDGKYFKALYMYNQELVPDYNILNPGTRLSIPSREALAFGFPDDCPALETDPAEPIDGRLNQEDFRSYVTRPGDTLWEIAGEQLGQTSRYREIHRMNQRQLAPELSYLTPLPAGIRLDLPPQ